MKTILVLAPHPQLAEAIRSALNPEHYRVMHRLSLEEAEPLFGRERRRRQHGLEPIVQLGVFEVGERRRGAEPTSRSHDQGGPRQRLAFSSVEC